MPQVNLDFFKALNLTEKLGVVRAMTRQARVVWASGEARPTDFTVLEVALQTLTMAGVGPLSTLPSPYDALVLVERSPQLAEDDPGCVDVTLRYEHILDGPNQNLLNPKSGILFGKGRCSITQKKTNFYYPNGVQSPTNATFTGSLEAESFQITNIPSTTGMYAGMTVTGGEFSPGTVIVSVDSPTQVTVSTASVFTGANFAFTAVGNGGKVMIVVGHSFGPLETGAVGATEYPGLPNFTMQTGEIDLPYPEANFQLQGTLSTGNPWGVANKFIACINKSTWMGKPALTWICSEVSWEMLEYNLVGPEGVPFYKFMFEFQYNNDTWNPVVVFDDKRTGRPPAGVIQANVKDTNGVLCLTYYPYVPTLNPTPPVPVPNIPPSNTQPIVPAGFWQVPALIQVDFDQQFGAFFEGFQIV